MMLNHGLNDLVRFCAMMDDVARCWPVLDDVGRCGGTLLEAVGRCWTGLDDLGGFGRGWASLDEFVTICNDVGRVG